MDSGRGIEDRLTGRGMRTVDHAVNDPLGIGMDERRMNVRAYNHWVSLLAGRAYPAIEDLDPAEMANAGANGVLLDFSDGMETPRIRYLGLHLRKECGVEDVEKITHVADVPARSLLSRLTDHYLQIIANRAPIGFEAEFVSLRGNNTVYRGILMPFSSSEDTIDFIYGVINWKELVDPELEASLAAEFEAACETAPRAATSASVWADGPGVPMVALVQDARDGDKDTLLLDAASAVSTEVETETETAADADPTDLDTSTMRDQLLLARGAAAAARAADRRARLTLHRALGRAYDLSLSRETAPQAYRELLARAGIDVEDNGPTMSVVRLVFGSDCDEARARRFADALREAMRRDVPAGGFVKLVDQTDGGVEALAKMGAGTVRD